MVVKWDKINSSEACCVTHFNYLIQASDPCQVQPYRHKLLNGHQLCRRIFLVATILLLLADAVFYRLVFNEKSPKPRQYYGLLPVSYQRYWQGHLKGYKLPV
ncbi:hypothetical protein LY16_02062 [Xenorhabdus doucetiae]|uniref:Uncharacterized protein n=1 Tax=Xenorhabdus doucetiae TaxID=351671 RepID=A0ABY3NRR8_9GAMM|nr:hypothetical protein LY16_02062 [Xenorhabdus doucetiae]